MAPRKRPTKRIEPRFTDDMDGEAALAFGLQEDDRPVPAGRKAVAPSRARRSAKSSERPRRGRKTKQRRRRSLLGRVIRSLLLMCVMAMAGLGVVFAYYASKLPPTAEWQVPQRAPSVRILAADGSLISNRANNSGATLTLDEMPAHLPEAVIAIEDRRFYWHFGVDPVGLFRAMFSNLEAGGVVQGGSTITQQLAKNLFLKPERTFERKVQEVVLALWLEAKLTKRQILELYLNRVYLGAGAYGVDAAAQRYFGKSARNVTLAEAARLAALLKAPSHYSPISNPGASETRAQVVLAAMHSAGFINDREAAQALASEVLPARDVAGGSGRYVADWVMDMLPRFVGSIEQDLIVDTTIDLRMQAAAARAVANTLAEEGDKMGVSQGALVAIDTRGNIRALVGGRDYRASQFNRALNARRQPGSAFKPFVYLAALERGLAPETVRIDQPVSIKGWKPQNYTKQYRGPVSLQSALALSLNTVSAQLASEVGPKQVVETARRLGISSKLLATPSIALGTSEVTPLEITGAFVPFSNGGQGVIPHVIDRIMTASGEVIYERSGSGPGQIVNSQHVGMMNSMLHETVANGTGRRAQLEGWQVAGKTGTSQDFRDAWFIGYTGVLTAGVWFGNDNNGPTNKASGSNMPATAWQRFMTEALAGAQPVPLPGSYRFRDPSNFEMVGGHPPSYATTGEDGRIIAEPGWEDRPAYVGSPPADIGAFIPTVDAGARAAQPRGVGDLLESLF